MTYRTIVVCGGGCYGGYYLRQLARARAAGVLQVERIVVVDRDQACRVARLVAAIHDDDDAGMTAHGWSTRRADATVETPSFERGYRGLPVQFVRSDWRPFFDVWFAEAIATPSDASRDAVVPSPLMPHLLSDWVESRVRMHRPGATASRVPMSVPVPTPWQRDAPDLAHYASFATWMCPINCIEPPRCPETRGPRDWTMPATVRAAAAEADRRGIPYDVVALFCTSHRVHGVGMFDVTDALSAEEAIVMCAQSNSVRVLVASVSHCHGALAELASERTPAAAEWAGSADRLA